MIPMKYELIDNQIFDFAQHLPDIGDKKIALCFTGGSDTTLLGKIMIDRYGKDKCVFIYFGAMFDNTAEARYCIWCNVEHGASILDIEPHFIQMNYGDFFNKDKRAYALQASHEYIRQLDDQIAYIASGVTKDAYELYELSAVLTEQFVEDAPSVDNIIKFLLDNSDKYATIIERYHIHYTTKFVEDIVCNVKNSYPVSCYKFVEEEEMKGNLVVPFKHLYKHQVFDLYYKMGFEHLLYQSRSCETPTMAKEEIHCGGCCNCQMRYDAHRKLGVEDRTVYKCDDNVKRYRAFENT